MMEFFSKFDTHQMISAFIVLLAIIDIIGSSPIILSLRSKGMKVSATNCTLISTILLLLFYFGGNGVLMIFNVDISSFAIAGSLLIFFMALEMILDIEILKNNEISISYIEQSTSYDDYISKCDCFRCLSYITEKEYTLLKECLENDNR